jgi:transcription initiation factor TFIIB
VVFDKALEFGPKRHEEGEKGLEHADISAGVDFALHDLGMGTQFWIPVDVSPLERARLRRLRVLQKRSRVGAWSERSLRDALLELDKLCEDLAIPKGVKSEVCVLYRQVKKKGLTAGRDLRLVLAAAIFITCRAKGIPRTENEIIDTLVERYGFGKYKSMKNLRRLSKLLSRMMHLEVRRVPPSDYINKFSAKLGISQKAVELAHDFCHKVPSKFTQGKSPVFLAAVFIYLGTREAGEKLTLRRIAKGLGIGVSSLSQNVARFKAILARGSR